MEVSSSDSNFSTAPADIQKTAQDVQERQVKQILESATEQAQKDAAHKTGLGTQLNVSA